MANPFEDPNNAYDNGPSTNGPSTNAQLSFQVTTNNTATGVGENVVRNEMNNINKEREDANKATANHNQRPSPPEWTEKCCAWLPIRTFAYFGGVLLAVLPWIDLVFIAGDGLTFSTFFLLFYIMLFGIMITIIESPTWRCTRKLQLGIYFWTRFCSRMWGRATFYVFISILSFGFWDQFSSVTGVAGLYLLIVALLMYYVSYTSAKKYIRIFVYIAAGAEDELLKQRFSLKFDELDQDKDGKIGSESIVAVALEAGRILTNAERHAIQSFLDESCNGSVSKDDWMKQFLNNNMKLKFL